jgi:TolB-like protein
MRESAQIEVIGGQIISRSVGRASNFGALQCQHDPYARKLDDVFELQDKVAISVAGVIEPTLPLPDKPSIAVLPFTNMSGDSEQKYFADGMVEEIITALSRVRWLFVIARNSTFTYKGQAVDVKQVGRELGVRYVLEGSVRKAGQRVRITGQLIDALTGTHLWADRFDSSLEDVFELQDKVAAGVAGVIEPTLQIAEIRRSSERPTADLTAYDLYLRALAHTFSHEKDQLAQALELLGRAIDRDHSYSPALGLAALCHQLLQINGWTDDQEATRRKGVDLARRAVRVNRGLTGHIFQCGRYTRPFMSRAGNPS